MERGPSIRLVLTADSGCFPRPEFRRDQVSYDVITPGAARGVLDRMHWRPAIRWVIDGISILRPIRFREGSRGGIENGGGRALVLVDVGYLIDAHFEMTERAGPADEMARHHGMFRRQARSGASIFLGSMDHPGEVRLCYETGEAEVPVPIDETRDLGWMVHEADYKDRRRLRFFRADMVRGVIAVPPPGDRRLFG